jgi:hypothetical protein
MYTQREAACVFALLHEVDAYVECLFCNGEAFASQCVQLLLGVRNSTLRAHAKQLCRARAGQMLTVAPTWGQPLRALALEVVRSISAQVPAHELSTEQVAALADLHARTRLEPVRELLQAAVSAARAAPTGDSALAMQMLAASACEVSLTPYLVLCQHVATAAQHAHSRGSLRQDVARALALRHRQAGTAAVVPQAVLAVLAACARIDWHSAHIAGGFRPLLEFVRVHARELPPAGVQGRVFLREAARAWQAQGPAAGGSDVACAEFLQMYTHVLEVQCSRLHASDAAADAEASLLLHAVQRIAATPPCLALRVCLPDLWCVVQGVQELRLSAHTPHTPTVLALLEAHARVLLSAPAPGLPPLPAASLRPCSRVRMGPRAVVRALEHVLALQAARRGLSDQYALIALAGHLVREAAPSTFRECQFPQRLEALATSAAALLLGFSASAARAPGPVPVASEHWDAVAFVNSCLNKLVHSTTGALSPAWQRCLHDVAEALAAFATQAAPGGFAPMLPLAYAFTRQAVMLLHNRRIPGVHMPPVLLGHVLAYAASEPAPVLLSAAASLHMLQRRGHPVVSHDLLVPFFAQLGEAPCTEDTRHLLVLVAARLCRLRVHASVCVADLLAPLLPRMQPRLGTLASISKALFAAVLAEVPLCRHSEHLEVLLAHGCALNGEVCEREAYYRLRIVLIALGEAPRTLGREVVPAVLALLQHVQAHALGDRVSHRVHTVWLEVVTVLLREQFALARLPECRQLVLAACAQEYANVHSRIALQALLAQALACELRAAVRGPSALPVCAQACIRE